MERAQLSTAKGKVRARLIAARHARHLSQDEVATQLQVSKVTVHRWEREGDKNAPWTLPSLSRLITEGRIQLVRTLVGGCQAPYRSRDSSRKHRLRGRRCS